MGYRLEIEERDLGGGWVEAYYLELETFRAMAIQLSVEPERRRLWELVAHGLDVCCQDHAHSSLM